MGKQDLKFTVPAHESTADWTIDYLKGKWVSSSVKKSANEFSIHVDCCCDEGRKHNSPSLCSMKCGHSKNQHGSLSGEKIEAKTKNKHTHEHGSAYLMIATSGSTHGKHGTLDYSIDA